MSRLRIITTSGQPPGLVPITDGEGGYTWETAPENTNAIPLIQKGAASGVATLDSAGHLTPAQGERIYPEATGAVLPTDSRIVHSIDLTGETASDEGWAEYLALGKAHQLADGQKILLTKSWALPEESYFLPVAGSAEIKTDTEQGLPGQGCALELTEGQTTLVVRAVGGRFRPASAESPERVYVSFVGWVTYTGLTSLSSEEIELTGVTGVTQSYGGEVAVMQGHGVYPPPTPPLSPTVLFGSGLSLLGPGSVSEEWRAHTEPEAMDGVVLLGNAIVDCEVSGWRHQVVAIGEGNALGDSFFAPEPSYSVLAFKGPNGPAHNVFTIRAGARWRPSTWTTIWIDPNASIEILVVPLMIYNSVGQGCPWGIWKEIDESVYEHTSTIAVQLYLEGGEPELGLGLIGSTESLGTLYTIIGNNISGTLQALEGEPRPPGYTPVGIFACQIETFSLNGGAFHLEDGTAVFCSYWAGGEWKNVDFTALEGNPLARTPEGSPENFEPRGIRWTSEARGGVMLATPEALGEGDVVMVGGGGVGGGGVINHTGNDPVAGVVAYAVTPEEGHDALVAVATPSSESHCLVKGAAIAGNTPVCTTGTGEAKTVESADTEGVVFAYSYSSSSEGYAGVVLTTAQREIA